MEKGKEGHHTDAAEFVRKGLNEFPGSHRLMYQLLFHLRFIGHIESDKANLRCIFKEAAEIGERILTKCTDDSIRHDTIREVMRLLCGA